MPNTNGAAIPLRQFGRHKVKISAVGFGGHHLGDLPVAVTISGIDSLDVLNQNLEVARDFQALNSAQDNQEI